MSVRNVKGSEKWRRCNICHKLTLHKEEHGELLEYSAPNEELWTEYSWYCCTECHYEDFSQ